MRAPSFRVLSCVSWALSVVLVATALSTALAPAARAQDAAAANDFGSATMQPGQGALIGILYDFKQDQKRETLKPGRYADIIAEFLKDDWDESKLDKYFRVSRPLYATRIYISRMSAEEAPKAFGVEDVVKPRLWIVHYKGQVSPPEAGTYRFAGHADDILIVRLNGRIVLLSSLASSKPPGVAWRPTATSDNLTRGDWITLKAGEIADMDVIVGEHPGGVFNAYLYLEKQGAPAGRPPIFKLAPGAPAKLDRPAGPDTSWSVWSAKQ